MATAPKYPRVIVSGRRHIKLAAEARKRNVSIQQVAEERFRKTDPK